MSFNGLVLFRYLKIIVLKMFEIGSVMVVVVRVVIRFGKSVLFIFFVL